MEICIGTNSMSGSETSVTVSFTSAIPKSMAIPCNHILIAWFNL